jgi:hypothetical protein
MGWLGAVLAAALIVIVLTDAFEVMILPRRVRHGYRLARLFYRATWIMWRTAARLLPAGRWRFGFLGIFGPLSLFLLVGIWATGLIFGFGLLHWNLGTALSLPRPEDDRLTTYLYFSGTTFFTLGYGDVVPTGGWGRMLSVIEAGIGFAFLAVVVSYLPVLYQAFSRREIVISLLDARAGSPPSSGELLRRLVLSRSPGCPAPLFENLSALLADWERWSAELLESHLSFPVLSYYRSQHDNQSWVGTLTTILDTTAVLIAAVDSPQGHQARLTFAMARHAAVDLGLVFRATPLPPQPDRLSEAGLGRLTESLRGVGLEMRDGATVATALAELRGLYEPIVNSLAEFLQFRLPPFQPEKPPIDNWQTSPWMPQSPGLTALPGARAVEDHFD